MLNLLNSINEQIKSGDKKGVLKYLVILFVIFLVIGLFSGALIRRFSSNNESSNTEQTETTPKEESYQGTVTYIESFLYPQDNISFVLVDEFGNDVILLKARDQKLEVAEGHFVTAYGEVRSTKDKTDKYLMVEKVILENATN